MKIRSCDEIFCKKYPSLLLFSKGELIDTKIGLSPKDDIVSWINSKNLTNFEAIFFENVSS